MASSVFVKNDQVFVDDKPVDLSKLQVIKDNDLFTRYELHSGSSVITITKSKVGNAISVTTKGPMTEAEKQKMKEMQSKIGDEVEKNIQQVQDNIKKFNQQLNDRIDNMNKHLQSMFQDPFPFF